MLVGRAKGGNWVISTPSMNTWPAVGASKPASIRSKVDLPQPEPPRMANNSPL